MRGVLLILTLLFFSAANCQERLDNLNKVFDEYEKKYQQKNDPYKESPNDTERIRQAKQVLNARRQEQIESNKLAKEQKEESNKYKNIEKSAIENANQSISGLERSPDNFCDAINVSQSINSDSVVTSAIKDESPIPNNGNILTLDNKNEGIYTWIIIVFCFILLIFIIIKRRKKDS